MKKLLIVFFCSALIFSSCFFGGSESSDEKRNSMKFEVGSKNDIPTKTTIKFNLDTLEKVLNLSFTIYSPEKIPYPVHGESKDTLRLTSLRFEFLCDNKPVAINPEDVERFNNKSNYCIPENSGVLIFHTDTFRFYRAAPINLSVPFYFFNSVLAGGNKAIQVRVYQDEFFSEERFYKKPIPVIENTNVIAVKNKIQDSVTVSYRNKLPQRSIDVLLSFNLNIPKIYSSTFICKNITLQNDTAWSPAGSDATLFRSSFPDIYFSSYFPENFLVHSSKIQKSTADWTIGDTSKIFYYSEKDIFKIIIMDHDNFSKDDMIEKWEGTIDDLKKSDVSPLKFGHVTKFQARLENTSVKN